MSGSRVIAIIMAAVLAWGLFHAVGAYRFNHNPWRSVVVLGCTLGFLGFWSAMLASRRSRLARSQESSTTVDNRR